MPWSFIESKYHIIEFLSTNVYRKDPLNTPTALLAAVLSKMGNAVLF